GKGRLETGRTERSRRKGPGRTPGFTRLKWSLRRVHPPLCSGAVERACIGGNNHPPERDETRHIGPGDRKRVCHAGSVLPKYGMAEDRSEARLEFLRGGQVEHPKRQAKFLGQLELARERRKARVGAIDLEPTVLAQKRARLR